MSRGKKISLNAAAARFSKAFLQRGKKEDGRELLFSLIKSGEISIYINMPEYYGGDFILPKMYWKRKSYFLFNDGFTTDDGSEYRTYQIDGVNISEYYLSRLKSGDINLSDFIDGNEYKDETDVLVNFYRDFEFKSHILYVYSKDVQDKIDQMPGDIIEIFATASTGATNRRGRKKLFQEYLYAACAMYLILSKEKGKKDVTSQNLSKIVYDIISNKFKDTQIITERTIENNIGKIRKDIDSMIAYTYLRFSDDN